MKSGGAHEIIAETPRHDCSIHELEIHEISDVIRAYIARMVDLQNDKRMRYVLTVVLDEINDLRSSEGKDVEISLDESKKRVILYTPQNRKLKARIVRATQCSPTALAQSDNR